MLLKNIFHNGKELDILIDDGKIAKIGFDGTGETDVGEVIDCRGKAILPSFANTHTHASMMFLRGIGEDKELFAWLNQDIWPREKKLNPELVYALSRFAILEMIKTGTTFFSDMYFYVDETVRAVQEMGVRAAISYVGMDFSDKNKTISETETMERFLSAKPPSERIVKAGGCHSVYTASEAMFAAAKDLCDKYGAYVHIHASETEKEVADCLNEFGCRPVELLYKRGMLGKKTVLAHCVHLSDAEIKIMADTGTVVAHCPASNMKLNSGRMPWQKYADAGLRLTIGTDGVSSNNSLSMITEMKIAALSAKSISNDFAAGRTVDVFKAATVNGFETFGFNAGKIEEGADADFILVDTRNPLLMPSYNMVSNMIYSADSSCITDVFCAGRRLMADGHVKDEDEIIAGFAKATALLDA